MNQEQEFKQQVKKLLLEGDLSAYAPAIIPTGIDNTVLPEDEAWSRVKGMVHFYSKDGQGKNKSNDIHRLDELGIVSWSELELAARKVVAGKSDLPHDLREQVKIYYVLTRDLVKWRKEA